ncbi:hypothetical protein NA57DRAFT_78706 [Rhizodiscina lignyota]|uniref:Uncharacterized protein n=1 Tax=Rhizodiscina lignyota TaxID=1504668 RepID=A0A9P4IA47_9PEZI|nr:hypothetical protein NA57DRAFT_78706 [Rhizodiscina lignyota]
MSAMVDTYATNNVPYAIPHRKPLPKNPPPPPPVPTSSNNDTLHSRTRTSSSSALPSSYAAASMQSASAYPSQPSMNQFIQGQPARRTLSNATTSTSSSGGAGPAIAPVRTPSALRRSGSERGSISSVVPTSYVALMRKQKATVWSERAQHEDARVLAAQKQAKMRATMEVVGGRNSGSYLSGRGGTPTNTQSQGLRSKIRHHGAQKTVAAGGNMAGVGVPMRLSANEVEGDSDEDSYGGYPSGVGGSAYHRRTGSGRSSLGSERRGASSQFLAPGQRNSSSSTPPSGQGSSPVDMERLDEETPVPAPASASYFSHPTKTGLSQGSSSGGSRENSFGQLAPMPEKSAQEREEVEKKRKSTQDELMRRGSVDERTTTMSGVRLFVANPDLSD